VIAALELDDPIATREGARHADGAERGLGARAHEPDALERRHQRTHALAELVLERARGAEARAPTRGRGDRLQQARRSVPVDERPPRHHVVDEAVAVHVFEHGAGGAPDEARRAAHRLEGANGTVHAAGEHTAGAFEERT
jgi:hypothetical protein